MIFSKPLLELSMRSPTSHDMLEELSKQLVKQQQWQLLYSTCLLCGKYNNNALWALTHLNLATPALLLHQPCFIYKNRGTHVTDPTLKDPSSLALQSNS